MNTIFSKPPKFIVMAPFDFSYNRAIEVLWVGFVTHVVVSSTEQSYWACRVDMDMVYGRRFRGKDEHPAAGQARPLP